MIAHIVLLCNPENRRANYFVQACARLNLPSPTLVAHEDWLSGRVQLEDILTPHTLVRLESPGESLATQRLLLVRGASHPDATCTAARAHTWQPEHGQIIHGAQRFHGWRDALVQLHETLETTRAWSMSSPLEVIDMFDKANTYSRLSRHQIDAPERLPPASCYEELRQIMREHGTSRVFLKPRFGSSASGVVALSARGARAQAITSTQLVEGARGELELFNCLRIQRYTLEREISQLVDALTREPTVCERWVPKATVSGMASDLRVVVINGQAAHTLGRRSASPMTNLHLGNTRVSWDELLERFGEHALEQAHALAARVMREAFPDTLYAGLDVMLTSGSFSPRVIEVNAFGDLLPNLLWEGEDTYTRSLRIAMDLATRRD